MSERKTTFYWASIAGADCEPVEVTMLDGERVAYTCGCGDPFHLDRPDCPVVLIYDPDTAADAWFRHDGQMNRPMTPKQARNKVLAAERRLKRDERLGIHHRWRGPR